MRQWKHICMFVSSTFRDMDVERDALRSLVEPKLNQYLAKYLMSVEFIDLRHNVKTDQKESEEKRERQICSICFKEIDRCTPYFIGLLGHRYGWIPPQGIVDNDCINVLPIKESELSVTLHEYNHGLLSKVDDVKGCIFIRKEESYRSLTTEELIDFVDGEKKKEYLDLLRKHVLTNDKIKSVEYDINLGNLTTESLGKWVDMVYNTIIDLLAPECNNIDTDDELVTFQASQERYVQRKTKNFKGRQGELEEFFYKMSSRNGCILAEMEYGTGMHSFMCAAYDQYRTDPENVCLFYSSQASIGSLDFNEVLYFWVKYLNRDYIKEYLSFPDIKDDLTQLTQKFTSYIQTLKKQGKEVYAFICDELNMLPKELASADIKLSHLCLYTNEVESLRPLIYMLEPFKKETVAHIIEPLRPHVRSRLMKHPRSAHPRWLALATMQLDKLDKMDFLSIRNNPHGDNEDSIVSYQLKMIDNYDCDPDIMLSKWYSKTRDYFGSQLIDKIIYTLGISEQGLPANICCSIANCSLTEFTMACHALGEDIVYEKEGSLWGLNNMAFLSSAIANMSAKNKNILLLAMERLVDTNHYLANSAFKIHILTGNIPKVIEMIESCKDYNELRTTSILNNLVWTGTFVPDKLKEFFITMIQAPERLSYTFLYRIINCIKELRFPTTWDTYLEIVFMLKERMVELWQNRRIDRMTHSLLGDIIGCTADAYYILGNYRAFDAELEYGISYAEKHMNKEPLWTNPYLYYIYRMINVHDHRSNFEILRNTVGPLERNKKLIIPNGEDTTIYAITLVETYKYYVANGQLNVMHLAQKAIDLFLDMVDGHLNTNTVLRPIDLIRNLLYNMHVIMVIGDNSSDKVLNEDWVQQTGWEIVRKCSEHKTLLEHDIALYYYYDLIGKLVKNCSKSAEEKVHDLYAHIFELIESNSSDYISFAVLSRNSSEVTNHFAAYLSLMSVILHELSLVDENQVASAEWIESQKSSGTTDIIRKETHLCFAEELKFILPLIGAKNMDGPSADYLTDSLVLLYESMINVQLGKSHPDRELLNKLYNSFHYILSKSEFFGLLPHRLTVIDRNLMLKILDEYEGDDSLFEDFSDCYGIDGDFFLKMWSKGDPDLDFKIEISANPEEHTWSRSELENRIKSHDYKSIIDKFSKKNRVSVYEAYYLGLALMRTYQHNNAFNVMKTLILARLPKESISCGEVFSIITNYLITCLLSHHFEDYIETYSSLSDDDREDEDVTAIHEAYLHCIEDGSVDIRLDKPYGYIL